MKLSCESQVLIGNFSCRNLADLDRDGKMTMQEFTIAVHLIQTKLKGVELPTSLPNSLKMTSMPSTFLLGQKAKPATDWGQPANQTVSNGFSKVGMMTLPHKNVTSGISWSGINQSPPQTRAAVSTSSSVFGSSFGPPMPVSGPSASLPLSFNVGMGSGLNTAASSTALLNGPGNQASSGFGPAPPNVRRTNSLTGGFGPTAAGPYGTITPTNRLKYNQMFKAHDYQKTGFLSGRGFTKFGVPYFHRLQQIVMKLYIHVYLWFLVFYDKLLIFLDIVHALDMTSIVLFNLRSPEREA